MKEIPAAVRCRSLEVTYGRVTALRGVDVDVPEGKLTTVIGPNGAGKTTLLRTICGLERPARGVVELAGEEVSGSTPEEMLGRGVALVPEGRHVFPHLSVLDNLRIGAFTERRHRAVVAARLERVFVWFPVLEEFASRLGGTLSGGEQQMLAIGRALMSEPSVLCLDEPSLGLAPRLVRHTLDLLRDLASGGVTVLLVEQFAYLALRAADHAYLLENGSVVRAGSGAELEADELVRASYLGVKAERAV